MLILLPDVNAFISDNTHAWVVYNTLTQIRDVGLCLVAIWAPKTYAACVVLLASASWYAGQAIDEATNGNFFEDGLWEFAWLAVVTLLTTLHLYFHDRTRRKTDQAKLDH